MENSNPSKPSSIGQFLVLGIVALIVIFGIIALFYNHEEQRQTKNNKKRHASDQEEDELEPKPKPKPIKIKAATAKPNRKTPPFVGPASSKKTD
ncbi:MAG: hypothetical protein QM523_02980 [Candidatus Pacebacteria bacterium]|nr:hypothetical protein [Candidatus Paceibacterota bacterium]